MPDKRAVALILAQKCNSVIKEQYRSHTSKLQHITLQKRLIYKVINDAAQGCQHCYVAEVERQPEPHC